MVAIDYPLRSAGLETTIPLGVMHPMHCLQSRAANVIMLSPQSATTKRQLDAAPIVLHEHLSEVLGAESNVYRARGPSYVLKALGAYLASNPIGTRLHQRTDNNPRGSPGVRRESGSTSASASINSRP